MYLETEGAGKLLQLLLGETAWRRRGGRVGAFRSAGSLGGRRRLIVVIGREIRRCRRGRHRLNLGGSFVGGNNQRLGGGTRLGRNLVVNRLHNR